MSIIELPGTPSAYAAGSQAGNYIAKSADAAANFACSLYKNYPGSIIGNPADSALRGLYDSLCKDRPSGLPSPPQSPFSGGQCSCKTYSVTVTWLAGSNGNASQQSATYTVVGKVKGVEIRDEGNTTRLGVYLLSSVCSGGTITGTFQTGVGSTPRNSPSASISSCTPVGFTDNCGNPSPSYPNDVKPPSGYTNGTGNITYNDGANLAIPLVYAPISANFDIDPNFKVDVGGVTFKFDLGGVKVDLGNKNSDTSQPRDRFNDPSDDFDRIERKINDVQDTVNYIKDHPPSGGGTSTPPTATPPDSDPNLEPDQKQPTDPKDETGISKLKWVKIVLTKVPDKVQFGDGAPNCYFAGWMEFKSGTSCFSREQINFQTSLFLAPAGADGYAYTLTNGAEGYAVVYRSKS